MTTLNGKQQAFIDYYLGDAKFNASEAARLAGYAHPGSQGNRLLQNVEISDAISLRVSERAMSADEALLRLSDHARSDMSDFLEFKSGVTTPYLNFQQAAERGRLHLIKKFKFTSEGYPEIELYDAQAALIQIGRVHGLFTDKSEVTGADGGELVIAIVKREHYEAI